MMFEKRKLKKTEYDSYKIRMRDGFSYHNKTAAKEAQIVFFGDSITEMLPISDWYGDYSLKSGLELYNRGISGDSSIGLYGRAKENVTCIKPSAVIILIGTNDIGFGLDGDFVKTNIEKALVLIKEECPECKIILQAIYPVIDGKAGKRKNSIILQTNKKLKAVAEKQKVTYLDFTDILADEKGNLRSEYTFDGLHLSAAGYEVTTREIIKHLP